MSVNKVILLGNVGKDPDVKHFDPEMAITSSGNVQGIEGGALPSVANFGVNVSVKF